MADDITLNSGSGGDTVGADDISSVKYQRIKLIHGADGTNDGDVATANPLPVSVSSNGTQNIPLFRYLDTVGNGTGTKNANGNYSSVQGIFRIAPPASTIYRISRMIISYEDTNGMTAAEYGNIGGKLSNGIQVRVHNGSSTIVDLTDGLPVTSNPEWARLCYDVDLKTWGAGNETMVVRWTFAKSGQQIRLDGDANEELQVLLDDLMTGLLSHYFMVQGYIESNAT